MNDKRFGKVGNIIDALGCAVEEAEESAVSLQHAGKPTAKAVWNGAADIRDRLTEISDCVDAVYRECEAEYATEDDEDAVDMDTYRSVLRRFPPARNVRADQMKFDAPVEYVSAYEFNN